MFAKYKHFTTEKSRKLLTAILIAVLVFAPFSRIEIADASVLKSTFVRFDRMQTSAFTSGTVCFNPSSTGTLSSIAVTYPTGYTLGTQTLFTYTTTNLSWPASASAATLSGANATVAGQTATWTLTGTYTTGTTYCFNWNDSTAAVRVAAAASASLLGTVTLSNGDTAQYATAAVTSDNILITATVPPVFSFALDQTADPLSTLNSSTIATGVTTHATVSTNAKNGWTVWARDSFTGLCSATVLGSACTGSSAQIPSVTPGTNSTLSTGVPVRGYNMGAVAGTFVVGTASIDAAFTGAGAGQGGGLDTSLRRVSFSAVPSDTAVTNLKNNVLISAVTPAAADYQDIVYLVAAGLF